MGIWELLKVVGSIAGLAAPATIPVGFCIILGHRTPPTSKGSLATACYSSLFSGLSKMRSIRSSKSSRIVRSSVFISRNESFTRSSKA